MADNNDGSIIINTELDNEGFEKGSDKLLGAVKDLTGAVDTLGDNMMTSFGQVIPLLRNIASSAASVHTAMADGAKSATTATARVAAVEAQVAQAAQQAAQQVQEEAQSINTLAVNSGRAQSTVSGLETQINAISSSLSGLSASAEKGFANGGAVVSFDTKLNEVGAKIDNARQKLEAFGAIKIPTEAYKWLSDNIQKADDELSRLYEREIKMKETGVKARSKAWKTLAYDIELAKAKIADYTNEQAQMEAAGTAFTSGVDTEEYQRMKTTLDGCAAALEHNRALIDAESLAQARLNVQAAQERVIRASDEQERRAALANLRTAQQELNTLASVSTGKTSAPKEEAITGWQRFGSVLKAVGLAGVKLVSTLAKLSFKAISAGVKAVTYRLKSFIGQSKKAVSGTKGLVKTLTSLKTLLKTHIKRMFISAIIDGVKKSMGSLAQFSSEFDNAMSNIKNRSSELTSNLTVSLGAFIQAVEPLITRVLDSVSKAITYFNALIASISGKTTVTVAKKKMDSYAASTENAAEAAEELKNQTYGFDQLNKRSSDSDSSSADSGVSYEEVQIDSMLPEGLSNWFDRIKTAFSAGDWHDLGVAVSKGLNSALGSVDAWITDTLRPKAVEWTGNIANALNGLEDGFDWAQLGATIAIGINTVFDIVNTFLTTFDFEKLGTGFANAINGLFSNMDWRLLGQTFANRWNALIDFVFNLVSTIDWSKVGESLSDLADSFLSGLNLEKATEAAGKLINGLFTAVGNFIENTDWSALAVKLGNSINNIFTTIDFGAAIKTIVQGFNAVVQTLADLIATIDWYQIGKDFADGITSLVTNIDRKALGELLSNAFIGLLDVLLALIGETDWGALIQNILAGIGALIETINWGEILAKIGAAVVALVTQIPGILAGALGGISNLIGSLFQARGLDGVAGFFKGIGDALANVGTWLKEHLVDPVVNGIKKLFGIHSPSTVFAEMGEFLIQGLLGGISAAWTGITEFFSDAISRLTGWLFDAWEGIKNTASNAWNGLKNSVTNIFNGAKTALTNTASSIKSGLSNAWSSVKSTATSAWNNIKTDVSGKFNTLKTNISNTANNIKSVASNAWNNIKSTASSKWNDIKSTVSDKWLSLKTTMSDTDWKSIGRNLVYGVKAGIANAWDGLKSWFSDKWDGLVGGVKDFLGINSPSKLFASIGDYMIQGLQVGMESEKGEALKTATNIAGSITDSFDEASPTLTLEEDATVAGLDAVASRLSGIATAFKAITAALNGMGGLRMPQIAAGTVVPVKTKVDATPGVLDVPDSVTELSNNVDERLADVSYLLKQLIAIVKALNLNIDMNALTEMVTQQQRSSLRNFGGV